MKVMNISDDVWAALSEAAWKVRENARLIGNTKVGAAALADSGAIFAGCNIEHKFRCHDVHAEVNALSSMIGAGCKRMVAILVAAERGRFTPCGGCMDWIMELGGPDCLVGFQTARDATIRRFRAHELMPHYPE